MFVLILISFMMCVSEKDYHKRLKTKSLERTRSETSCFAEAMGWLFFFRGDRWVRSKADHVECHNRRNPKQFPGEHVEQQTTHNDFPAKPENVIVSSGRVRSFLCCHCFSFLKLKWERTAEIYLPLHYIFI